MKKKIEEYGDILSPKDIHDILGIGYNKTYELLRNQQIRNFKIGRERKIPRHCLISYIENNLALENAVDDEY